MILVDTSIWIDYLRRGDVGLATLLTSGRVLAHPTVVGEVGLGSLTNRAEILGLLARLPQAASATHDEVMAFVETRRLFGLGIGYVDAHILASTALTAGATLWTRDKRLRSAAESLNFYAAPS